jgi:hypothetical protein
VSAINLKRAVVRPPLLNVAQAKDKSRLIFIFFLSSLSTLMPYAPVQQSI